jgi:hypothetical protein
MSTGHPYLRRRVRPGPAAAPTSTASATTGADPSSSAPSTVPGGAASGSPRLAPPSGPDRGSVGGTGGGTPPRTGADRSPTSAASGSADGGSGSAGGGRGGSGSGLSLSFGSPAAPSRTPAAPSHPGTPTSRPTTASPTTPARSATAAAGSATAPAGSASAPSGPSDRVARRLAARAARIRPFPAPDPHDVRVLGPDHPVVRIDRRRSAVGALRVTGATSAAWETTGWTVGAETVDGAEAGRSFRTAGNRPLVGFDGGAVLVALRHVRRLRRALVMGRGTDRLVVALHDGTTLAVDPGDADTMTVLALSVVDGELELRAEPFPRSSHDGEVFAAFGFVLSAPTVGA